MGFQGLQDNRTIQRLIMAVIERAVKDCVIYTTSRITKKAYFPYREEAIWFLESRDAEMYFDYLDMDRDKILEVCKYRPEQIRQAMKSKKAMP